MNLKLPTATTEGQTMNCPICKNKLVARLKTYKNDEYPAYIQWQNEKENKAHIRDGQCSVRLDEEVRVSPNEPSPSTSSNQVEANIDDIPPLNSMDADKVIKATKLLCKIRNQITETTKEYIINPHPGMIWEMTALIYQKHFTTGEEGGNRLDD